MENKKEIRNPRPNWHYVWISIVVSEALTVVLSYVLYGKVRGDLLALSFIMPLILSPVMIYLSYRRRMNLEFRRAQYRRKLEAQVGLKSAELVESEKKYRAIFEHSPVGIVISDHNAVLLEANETMCRMLGYGQQEIKGSFKNITHPGDIDENIKYIREMQAGDRDSFEMDKRYIRKDGSIMWGRLYVRSVRNVDGKYLYNLAMIEDITERMKYEREKMKARNLESLGVFAGGIAHDFNNMLAIILNNLSVAGAMQQKGENIDGKIKTMQAKVHEAKGMAQQLMTFAEGGAPVCRAVSVRRMLKDTVSFSLAGSGVRGEFDILSGIENVTMDTAQISQVINNIVLNAKEAMAGSGVLTVEASSLDILADDISALAPGRYVRISFCDTGPGIPPEVRERIFDPYFSTRDRGAGLGLAMAYSIMKKHKGMIDTDAGDGGGACFVLHLPVTGEAVEQTEVRKPGESTQRSLNVLLMDDDPELRASTGELLELLSHSVVLAADGAQAVKVYAEALETGKDFDLVVLDLTVTGGMGGIEALKRLRELDGHVRVVLSSGYSKEAPLEDYVALGFDAALLKPYSVDDINHALEAAMGDSV